MLKTPLVAVVTALLLPGAALAQEPDTAPPSAVLKVDTTLNTIDSMIGGGLTFSADPSEDLTYTGTVTIKSKGKTVTVAKSIRTGELFNSGGGFIEQTLPRGSDRAIKSLIKIKKHTKTAVTLTLLLRDAAGNQSTVKKTVKLKKRY